MAAYTYKQVYDRLPRDLIDYYGPALNPGYDGELHSAAADYIDRLQVRLDYAEGLLMELSAYFDNYADVTDSDRGVAEVPNKSMEWKQRIDTLLSGRAR